MASWSIHVGSIGNRLISNNCDLQTDVNTGNITVCAGLWIYLQDYRPLSASFWPSACLSMQPCCCSFVVSSCTAIYHSTTATWMVKCVRLQRLPLVRLQLHFKWYARLQLPFSLPIFHISTCRKKYQNEVSSSPIRTVTEPASFYVVT